MQAASSFASSALGALAETGDSAKARVPANCTGSLYGIAAKKVKQIRIAELFVGQNLPIRYRAIALEMDLKEMPSTWARLQERLSS